MICLQVLGLFSHPDGGLKHDLGSSTSPRPYLIFGSRSFESSLLTVLLPQESKAITGVFFPSVICNPDYNL